MAGSTGTSRGPILVSRYRPQTRSSRGQYEILRYQWEGVDVLYTWASTLRTIEGPSDVVPAEPGTQPTRPAQDASLAEWHDYYLRMTAIIEWQMDVEHWRGNVESRLEGSKAIIPEILQHLGPESLSIEHQRSVQVLVKRLHDATGKPFGTIYDEVKTAFQVPC